LSSKSSEQVNTLVVGLKTFLNQGILTEMVTSQKRNSVRADQGAKEWAEEGGRRQRPQVVPEGQEAKVREAVKGCPPGYQPDDFHNLSVSRYEKGSHVASLPCTAVLLWYT
jgi:hypothetical protein